MDITKARRQIAFDIATEALQSAPQRFESPLAVLASPAWRGVEADIWVAETADKAAVFKHYHDDTSFYVDATASMKIAQQAGRLGVSPQVDQTWPEHGLMQMHHLGDGWRAGGLHDAYDAAVRSHVIAAKKAIQAGPRFARDANVFDDIEHLHGYCTAHQARLPRDMPAFLDFSRQAGAAIRAVGIDSRPCHRDGNTSNLMIGPGQEVQLLDFDLAANADPCEDIGCYLLEMFEREPEARAGFEEWHGTFSESLFQRAMTYGIVDDLRWGLIAAGMAATSPRTSLEFAKYASWRFLRYELRSQSSHGADRLRALTR